MGDILSIGGTILGGIVGGPAGAAIGGGLGSLLGGGGGGGGGNEEAASLQQASGLTQAGAAAAGQQANQGFNYYQNSPVGTSYLPAGAAANDTAASLLGITPSPQASAPSGPAPGAQPQTPSISPGMAAAQSVTLGHARGGNNTALQDIRQALALGRPISDASWAQAGFGPGGSAPGSSPSSDLHSQVLAGLQTQQAAPAAAPAQSPQDAFGNYLNSTGYQFRANEGMRGLVANNATRGLLNSGATIRAAQRYNQNLASGEFNNYLNQVNTVANRGLQAGQLIGGAATSGGLAGAGYTAQAGGAAGNYAAQAGHLPSSSSQFAGLVGNQFNSGGLLEGAGNYLGTLVGGGPPSSISVTPQVFGTHMGGYVG